MVRTRLMMVALIGAVAFAGSAMAAQDAWKRQYVGKSPLSLTLPGKLESAGETKVEDKDDWVATTDDFSFESDEFYLLISVFNGRPGTTADDKHLAQVAKDLVAGMSDKEEDVKVNGYKAGKLDEKPTVLQSHTIGKGDKATLFKSFLLGDGTKVYAVMAVGYPSDPKSVAAIDKAFNSIRYKAGLKD